MAWEIAAALAASAAASLLYSNYQSNQSNAYNSAEAEKEREWQTYMSNTAYQRSVADMKAAGLNPIVSGMNTSSASSGAGASASSATSVNSNAGDIAGAASNVLNAMSNAQNADTQESLAQSQEALNATHEAVNASTERVNNADTTLKEIQSLRENNLISYDNARILSEFELQNKMKADAALATAQANTEQFRPAHVQAMTNESNARAAQSAMETRERPDLYFSESVRNYSQAGINSAQAGSQFYDRLERYNDAKNKGKEQVKTQRKKHDKNPLKDWDALMRTVRHAWDNY